jgi:plasmid stabilization system protein ParE
MYTVLRHPKVRNDLLNIASFIQTYSSTASSERKIRAIENRISRLRRFPHVGTIRDDIFPGLRAIPVAEKGVICFQVDDTIRTVFIICIAYAGSNWVDAIEGRAEI